jgi:tetratricopeptide (TPR) repeat protein
VLERALEKNSAREAELRRDHESAGLLYDELIGHPPEQWAERIKTEERFRSPGVARLVLAAARDAAPVNPARAEELAGLALAVAEALAPGRVDELTAAELRAQAWCLLGEARRLRADPEGAEQAFAEAVRVLAAEPLDVPARAVLCRGLARLRAAQGRADEALGLLARATALFEQTDEFEELGETLADQGWILLDEEDPELALPAFQAAFPLLDPAACPRMARTALRIRHGLALCYADLGRRAKARAVLEASRELHDLLPEAADRLRIAWIEEQVAERTGGR